MIAVQKNIIFARAKIVKHNNRRENFIYFLQKKFLILFPISFLLITSPRLACGQVPASPAEQLRAAASRLLSNGSADDAEKAADILDKASQIDARMAEIANDNTQSRTLEQEIENGLAPLISTVVLAATLFFNIYQARIAERGKREDDIKQRAQAREDRQRQDEQDQEKRFNDALDLMLKSENFSPAAALIGSFISGPYQDRARAAGVSLMHKTRSYDTFKDLFATILSPVTDDNLQQVIDMLRSIHVSLEPLLSASWTGTENDTAKLRLDQADTYNLLVAERMFVSQMIAAFLRKSRPSPQSVLDLSHLGFDTADFSGLDLRGAKIDPAAWNYVTLDGCDLRGIAEFSNCWFYNTAWWRVNAIDRPFLELLKKNCPYEVGKIYPKLVSQVDYDEHIVRLERAALV